MTEATAPPTWTANQWVDYWRYQIGVNVISADTRNKTIYEEWKEWQNNPIPEELHNQWKTENKFSKGMAVILGKVWHNKQKYGLYLNGIDADNLKAIEEVCTYSGKTISIQDLANWTLVEQHPDNTNKAHIYIYSRHKPFAKKSSDKTAREAVKLIESNEIPAIEVKGEGGKSTLFCCPSVHQDGHRYQILGTQDPVIADDFEGHINNICKKYGLNYLWNGNGDGNGISLPSPSSHLIPIEELFKPDTRILAGHNRHEALLRVMESLISRNKNILSLDKIKGLARQLNTEQLCDPPLNDREFEKQWKCAIVFIAKNNGNGNSQTANGSATNTKEQDREHQQSQPKEFTVFKYSQDVPLAEEINLPV
jgi:putative DNA primase/helicase